MRGWVVLALLGCGPSPTSASIEVRLGAGEPTPGPLTLDVFDATRALVQNRQLPAAALPSRVILELPALEQPLRVVIRGSAGTVTLLGGVVVQAHPHQQVLGTLI